MPRSVRALRFPSSCAAAALILAAAVQPVAGQEFRMPSSLRYGSGLLDIPVASVLPHLAIVGSYSGFNLSVNRVVVLDRAGREVDRGNRFDKWNSDGSLTFGFFDRIEVGATIQHYDSEEDGGNMLGGFARASLLPASIDRIGLAVGARYVSSPSYGTIHELDLQPGRLGHPDYRLVRSAGAYPEDFDTNLSPYVVATAHAVRTGNADMTLTAGWGTGMFKAGSDRDFYADAAFDGLFGGVALHRGLGAGRVLHAMAEFNGFDVNAGVQVDAGGIRVGAFALGVLYDDHSTYRSRKFGILGSVAFCGAQRKLCAGRTRPEPPPPPPSGPTAEELERMRQDSIARARAEEERRLDAERERAERERARRAAEERGTLEERVFFDYDESAIREDAAATLRRKVEILLARPGVELRIEAHADERGSEEYNLDLGQRRGDAVLAFLVEAGLDASRFAVRSHGEANPLVQGATEEAWARNRRVEFIITAGLDDLGRERPR
ncbi:MAG: OmpA family protein [Gemmatimonadetes bacterium]|nr:OmpA family protein [Gemmatimonadota bacterium]MYI46986.1 OmpA family protein [Gemmatimonadota bacterium]